MRYGERKSFRIRLGEAAAENTQVASAAEKPAEGESITDTKLGVGLEVITAEVAKANNFDRPILHGLCTFGIAARMVAEAAEYHPCDLRTIKARLSAPVMPGETITVSVRAEESTISFEANVNDRAVIKGGEAVFAS